MHNLLFCTQCGSPRHLLRLLQGENNAADKRGENISALRTLSWYDMQKTNGAAGLLHGRHGAADGLQPPRRTDAEAPQEPGLQLPLFLLPAAQYRRAGCHDARHRRRLLPHAGPRPAQPLFFIVNDSTLLKYRAVLARYLQEGAIAPVLDFMQQHCVDLHITRSRKSKLGDYRWPQPGYPRHAISVNGNLTPYMFLMVLLHEQAHLLTYETLRLTVKPHGHEWQEHYRSLLRQYAAAGLFPPESLALLRRYTARIPLYSPANRELEALLMRYDKQGRLLASAPEEPRLLLSDLPVGTHFHLTCSPERHFVSREKLRTRFRCMDTTSQLLYMVSGNAPVEIEEKT